MYNGSATFAISLTSFALIEQVNIRRYNTVCGPGQCEWQEQAAGRLQNWQLQNTPDPQLVEVGLRTKFHTDTSTCCSLRLRTCQDSRQWR